MSAPLDPRLARRPVDTVDSPASPSTGKRKAENPLEGASRAQKLKRAHRSEGSVTPSSVTPGSSVAGSPFPTPTEYQVPKGDTTQNSRIHQSLGNLTRKIQDVSQKEFTKSETKNLWRQAQRAKAGSKAYCEKFRDLAEFYDGPVEAINETLQDRQKQLFEAEKIKVAAQDDFIAALSEMYEQPVVDHSGHVSLEDFKATVDALYGEISALKGKQKSSNALSQRVSNVENGQKTADSEARETRRIINQTQQSLSTIRGEVKVATQSESYAKAIEESLKAKVTATIKLSDDLAVLKATVKGLELNRHFSKRVLSEEDAKEIKDMKDSIRALEQTKEERKEVTNRQDTSSAVNERMQAIEDKLAAVVEDNADKEALLDEVFNTTTQGINDQIQTLDASLRNALQELEQRTLPSSAGKELNNQLDEMRVRIKSVIDGIEQRDRERDAVATPTPGSQQPQQPNGFALAEGTTAEAASSLPSRNQNGTTMSRTVSNPQSRFNTATPVDQTTQLSSEIQLDSLNSRLDALTRQVQQLQVLHNNLTTNEIHQQMVDQIGEQYPYLKQYQQTCEHLQAAFAQFKTKLMDMERRGFEDQKSLEDSLVKEVEKTAKNVHDIGSSIVEMHEQTQKLREDLDNGEKEMRKIQEDLMNEGRERTKLQQGLQDEEKERKKLGQDLTNEEKARKKGNEIAQSKIDGLGEDFEKLRVKVDGQEIDIDAVNTVQNGMIEDVKKALEQHKASHRATGSSGGPGAAAAGKRK